MYTNGGRPALHRALMFHKSCNSRQEVINLLSEILPIAKTLARCPVFNPLSVVESIEQEQIKWQHHLCIKRNKRCPFENYTELE